MSNIHEVVKVLIFEPLPKVIVTEIWSLFCNLVLKIGEYNPGEKWITKQAMYYGVTLMRLRVTIVAVEQQ